MIRPQSLTSRLILYCAAGSFLILVLSTVLIRIPTAAILGGYSNFPTLEAWTTRRARETVLNSIRVDKDGNRFVEESAELNAHLRRNPEFRFAVFDEESAAVLPGSSPEFVPYFSMLKPFVPISCSIRLPGDADRRFRGSLRQESSSFGSFQILVYGSYFHWDDIIYQLIHSWPQLNNFTLDVSGVAIAIIAIAAVGVRRGLAPLRTLATTVASIDVDSLDQRLSTAGAPSETLPFIDAVNAALGRVHEGVARQRRFTANAAHELRSPITIIRSRVETLDESPTKQELSRDVLRMQTIVEQLLVLAKLKERSSAEFEIVDVRRVALAVATDYAPIAIDSGKMIEFEGPPHSVMARGFRWAIESILTNLIANALRAEPKSGTIVVRVGEAAIVEVIDHGAGVAPNERSMIFEQFWRRDENSPGSGLGLTIAQELAHELGGSILVEDTPGGGATFKLSLRFGISADNANSVEKCGREPTP